MIFLSKYHNIHTNYSNSLSLNEISMNRFMEFHWSKGHIIISASRNEYTEREKYIKHGELIKELKNAEYAYTPVYGGYIETDDITNKSTQVYERSVIIFNFDRDGYQTVFKELSYFGLYLCKKFNLESYLSKALVKILNF